MFPSLIGRYEVKFEIGRGGMATVYHAYDPRFERDVAIKLLPSAFLHDPQFRLRFEREAKMIAMLEHPAIVPVYDFGEQDGQPYIVMRYMSGGSLTDRLRCGRIPLEEARQLVERLAPALDAAHAKGVIHRDLKPANILYDQYGNAFLSDFGIARLTQPSAATLTGDTILGTPAYMSPEQVQGEAELDGRSDIYSLGIILYQMLAGRVPFRGDTPTKIMLMHVLEPVPNIMEASPDAPPGVAPVLARALAKKPQERYRSAGEMAQALQAALLVPPDPVEINKGSDYLQSRPPARAATFSPGPEGTAFITPPTGSPPARPAGKKDSFRPKKASFRASRIVAGVAMLAAIILAGVGGFYLVSRQEPASAARLAEPSPAVTQSPAHTAENMPAALLDEDTGTPTLLPTVAPTQAPAARVTEAPPPATETEAPLPAATEDLPPLVPVIGGADKVAFLNENDIWIANLDGGGLTRLTEDGARKANLQWSPDGQAVHYISGKCVQMVDINTLRMDKLACFEGVDYLEAFEISPDGAQVAISLNRELYVVPFDRERLAEAKYRSDLQSMAGCASLAPYTHGPALIAVKGARWSRDGKQLAINRLAVGDGKQVDLIQLLDISNCSVTIDRLDEFPATRFRMDGYETSPYIQFFTWDGNYLFALNSIKRNDGFGDLWIYSSELHRAYQATPIEEGCCYRDAVWSPDGSHLLFTFQDRSKAPENVTRLYVVPYASLGTGMVYVPLPLPEDFFSDPRAKPMAVLRPAP